LNLQPTYISIPSKAGTGSDLFEQGLAASGGSLPDWWIVDDFFKNKSIIFGMDTADQGNRVLWLQAGEKSKTLAQIENILEWLVNSGAKRDQCVAVVGGGTILDIGLFAVSIYQRGLKKWALPTTLLAAVDAGIGGKNGVNFMGFKNYVGTISQPDFVITDARVLDSLEAIDVLNGWMEMVKHALIADPSLWQKMQLFGTIPPLKDMRPLIAEAAAIKQNIVRADPNESGIRKTLNFGHTVAHALESDAVVRSEHLPHGIAVGLGMVFSLHWSAMQAENSKIKSDLLNAAKGIKHWLVDGAPAYVHAAISGTDIQRLWQFMVKDKKNDTQGVQEVRLTSLGSAKWNELLTFTEFEANWTAAHASD